MVEGGRPRRIRLWGRGLLSCNARDRTAVLKTVPAGRWKGPHPIRGLWELASAPSNTHTPPPRTATSRGRPLGEAGLDNIPQSLWPCMREYPVKCRLRKTCIQNCFNSVLHHTGWQKWREAQKGLEKGTRTRGLLLNWQQVHSWVSLIWSRLVPSYSRCASVPQQNSEFTLNWIHVKYFFIFKLQLH